ncbi:J domain-containing protein [Anabaenopsis tanganyikae CS-531]|uniref:J domain-containing protein n=2 Tax=Anabaenopsis TaxID=110103 RepID=A0ABT5AM28_9CYAN|nr:MULTISPECIES: J domain-containing protein [Anabaenopsis]MDB9538353.1 J domain-containing protein [Anabaenopsis arnoldii]MDH6090618.1 J domain-containing protein [Anabaenopsis arnoldii]MDH6107350.1 J domain-containing protein [Anabaenopsis tanganyikae CS-531]
MPKKRTPSSQSATTTSLALSSIHLRMENLDKEHKWLLKQIKRKRTELQNFLTQMSSVATDVLNRYHPHFQELVDIDREIHTLFDEILNKRKLGKQSKKDIQAIYYQLQFARIITPEPSNYAESQDTEEVTDDFSHQQREEHSQYQEPQESLNFSSVNKSEAARKIRQTFLSLAEIFHPDKVKDRETQILHTEIMKEINKAYQEGDLARLLEIEQQHQSGKYIDMNNQDDLNRQCMRIEQQNQILKTQYHKLKQELRQVKNTPEGAMVTDCRKAARAGIDAIASMAEQLEAEIKTITAIRDFVRAFREQKITISEFLARPEIMRTFTQDTIDEHLEEMFFELGEIMFF